MALPMDEDVVETSLMNEEVLMSVIEEEVVVAEILPVKEEVVVETHIMPRSRPDTVMGITERVKIGCGNLYITVNYDDQGICELFTNTGKAGGCPSQSEATARLASIALRSGIDVKSIVDQLKGIRCPSTIRQSGMKCTSCPDAIAKTIDRVYRQQVELGIWPVVPDFYTKIEIPDEPVLGDPDDVAGKMKFCPECGAKLEHEGGCVMCRQCGYSKCG